MSTNSTGEAQIAAIQESLASLKATVTKTNTIEKATAVALVETLQKICTSTLEIAKIADQRYSELQSQMFKTTVEPAKDQNSYQAAFARIRSDDTLEPGQTQLYQALHRRDWDKIYTLALQPDQVADMTPEWMSDVVSDFIQAQEAPEKILGLFEVFGRFNKAGLELILDPVTYEVFGHLLNFNHIAILRRLNQLGLLGKDHRQFLLNRMSHVEEYLIELFPTGLTKETI